MKKLFDSQAPQAISSAPAGEEAEKKVWALQGPEYLLSRKRPCKPKKLCPTKAIIWERVAVAYAGGRAQFGVEGLRLEARPLAIRVAVLVACVATVWESPDAFLRDPTVVDPMFVGQEEIFAPLSSP